MSVHISAVHKRFCISTLHASAVFITLDFNNFVRTRVKTQNIWHTKSVEQNFPPYKDSYVCISNTILHENIYLLILSSCYSVSLCIVSESHKQRERNHYTFSLFWTLSVVYILKIRRLGSRLFS